MVSYLNMAVILFLAFTMHAVAAEAFGPKQDCPIDADENGVAIFPETMTRVPDACGCSKNLHNMIIPPRISSFGYKPFQGCTFRSATLPNNLTLISGGMFYQMGTLQHVNIPPNVITIDIYAFYYCTSLTTLNIPNTTTTVRSSALTAVSIQSVTIPDSLYYIGPFTFYAAVYLESINISEDNGIISIEEGFCSYCYELKSFTVPKSVSQINNRAFYQALKLKDVKFAGTLYYILDEAFAYCKSLTQIALPDTVNQISDSVFAYSNLSSFTIPSSVKYMGTNVFQGCTNLTSLTWPPYDQCRLIHFSSLSPVGNQTGCGPDVFKTCVNVSDCKPI
eukprot:m.341913 g.341913  ORF g.341913 m.341913 type:complete len:335 (+) comp20665_c0_seq1:50-1054(+)